MRACELDGALGGNPSFKSSTVGAFTWSSMRWFQSVVVGTKRKKSSCAVRCLSEGLRSVWTFVLFVCSLLSSPGILFA